MVPYAPTDYSGMRTTSENVRKSRPGHESKPGTKCAQRFDHLPTVASGPYMTNKTKLYKILILN